jgi:hypothetical protein
MCRELHKELAARSDLEVPRDDVHGMEDAASRDLKPGPTCWSPDSLRHAAALSQMCVAR